MSFYLPENSGRTFFLKNMHFLSLKKEYMYSILLMFAVGGTLSSTRSSKRSRMRICVWEGYSEIGQSRMIFHQEGKENEKCPGSA